MISNMYLTRSLALNTMTQTGGIIGVEGEYFGAIIRLQDKETLVIGRDAVKCNLVVNFHGVSRVHCTIQYLQETSDYAVVDYSTYGTVVDNRYRLEKNHVYRCARGSQLAIGGDNVFKLV